MCLLYVLLSKAREKCVDQKNRYDMTDRHISYKMVLQITCGEQGWRSVESDRLTPCCLGSDPARCHIWVEFVVDSRLGPSVFLRVLQFSSLQNFFQIRIRSG